MKTMLLSLAAALLLLAAFAAQAEAGGNVPMDWRSLSYSKSAMCYDYSFSFYVYRDSKGDRRVCCNFLYGEGEQLERCELENALVTRKERAEIDQLEKVVNLLAWDIVEPKQPDDGCVALDADERSLELEMDSQAVFTAELTAEQEKELCAALQALCKKLQADGTDERM